MARMVSVACPGLAIAWLSVISKVNLWAGSW
jgi:hypothetical protein